MPSVAHVRGLIFRADLSAESGDMAATRERLHEALRAVEEIAASRTTRIVSEHDHAHASVQWAMRREG